MPEEMQPQETQRRPDEEESLAGETHLEPRARILVIEDERDLRELLAEWLETKGYEVAEAADGQDAVELLEAGLEPDVILLDLTMPRMNGWAFLGWLRADPKHRDRRVLVASAYARDFPPEDANGTVAKPFRPELLARELARLAADA
jgi:CheY-like chemotaxis protein